MEQLSNKEFFTAAVGIALITVLIAFAPAGSRVMSADPNTVLPQDGVILPAAWGDLGRQLIAAGVIDQEKFEELYANRGGLDEEANSLLYGTNNGKLKISEKNSGMLLNLLWAFGLANKNQILEEGPMTDKENGSDAGRFASTGGWSLAKGRAMDHYSRHVLVVLNPDEQALVEKVSKNIFRPCCGNSTYFPDCNHGMAMLGLLELMAGQGVSESEMYKAALAANSYWFPDTYLTLAKYFAELGIKWKDVDPKEVLGAEYSSAVGYQQVLSKVEPEKYQGGGGCGI